MRTVRKLLSFNVFRCLLWIGFAAAGFASRANAYDCYDSNTCICGTAWTFLYTQGWHCCYNWCDLSSYPYCGTPGYYDYWLKSCAIGCVTANCAVIDYFAEGTECSCDTCT